MIIKYEIEAKKDPLKVFKQEKLAYCNKINITDLNNYLFTAEKELLSIKDKINNKKNEISKFAEDPNNQFIEVIDSNENKRFINNQYLKLMKEENGKFNKNIYSFYFYDYNNEGFTLMKKNLENIGNEDKIYVEIKNKDKNYLINKNKLLKIYDSWKILYQGDIIDAFDATKITNKLKGFDNEKINFLFLDVNPVVQDVIKEIKINEKNEDNKDDKYNNNNINNIVKEKEKEEDNIMIVEEDNNANEYGNKLRNEGIIEDKVERKKKIIEYFNNLPSKNTYTIKYKIKTERIPKKK